MIGKKIYGQSNWCPSDFFTWKKNSTISTTKKQRREAKKGIKENVYLMKETGEYDDNKCHLISDFNLHKFPTKPVE